MQAAPISQVQSAAAGAYARSAEASDDGFDFWDFLDIINPLQHLPVISSIYRAISGDEIDPMARLIGGGLYGLGLLGGGWIGLAAEAVDVAVEEATGDDIAGHLIAFAFGEDGAEGEAGGGETAVAGAGSGSADGDAAVQAAAARPAAVVVRSDPLSDTPAQPLFAGPAPAAAEAPADAAGLAAVTGQVVSPATSQALLLAAQSDDPAVAEALNRMLPRGASQPGRVREFASGQVGYSLDDVEVQVGRGIFRDATGGLSTAAS